MHVYPVTSGILKYAFFLCYKEFWKLVWKGFIFTDQKHFVWFLNCFSKILCAFKLAYLCPDLLIDLNV